MASVLVLDRTQPEVDKLVSAWENGGQYELRLVVRQDSADEAAATFRVLEVEDVGEGEEAAPVAKKAPKTMEPVGDYTEGE